MNRETLARNGQMSLQEIAEHEGISVKTVNMTALAVMLRPGPIGGSQTYRVRGLKARGYKPCVPGIRSQAERVA